MRVTEVTVSYGVTVNLGNYESARFDFSTTAQVDGNELPTEVRAQLLSALRCDAQDAMAAAYRRSPTRAALELAKEALAAERAAKAAAPQATPPDDDPL